MRAVVTGAAAGIGAAIARRLASDGARLVLVDRDGKGLETLSSELAQGGVTAFPLRADLAEVSSAARVIEVAVDQLGGLDVLVSNAGIVTASSLVDLSLEDYERTFAINTRATWLLGKHAHSTLRESRGSFIIVSSLASELVSPMRGAYSASKAAVAMLMRQLAFEWGPDGIRVNAIAPGGVETPMTRAAFSDPAAEARRFKRIPAGRLAMPEEIAAVASFLAGPDSSYVTGENLVVDGGMRVGMMAAFRDV